MLGSFYDIASRLCMETGKPVHLVKAGSGELAGSPVLRIEPDEKDEVLLTFRPAREENACPFTDKPLECEKLSGGSLATGGTHVEVFARADLKPGELHEFFQLRDYDRD
jgi:hypothetical protein